MLCSMHFCSEPRFTHGTVPCFTVEVGTLPVPVWMLHPEVIITANHCGDQDQYYAACKICCTSTVQSAAAMLMDHTGMTGYNSCLARCSGNLPCGGVTVVMVTETTT